jgi:hypothetical protein
MRSRRSGWWRLEYIDSTAIEDLTPVAAQSHAGPADRGSVITVRASAGREQRVSSGWSSVTPATDVNSPPRASGMAMRDLVARRVGARRHERMDGQLGC